MRTCAQLALIFLFSTDTFLWHDATHIQGRYLTSFNSFRKIPHRHYWSLVTLIILDPFNVKITMCKLPEMKRNLGITPNTPTQKTFSLASLNQSAQTIQCLSFHFSHDLNVTLIKILWGAEEALSKWQLMSRMNVYC